MLSQTDQDVHHFGFKTVHLVVTMDLIEIAQDHPFPKPKRLTGYHDLIAGRIIAVQFNKWTDFTQNLPATVTAL